MKTITKTVYVHDDYAKKIQKCIDDNKRFDPQVQKDEYLKGWVTRFGETIAVDIRIYDSDNGPWIDAYLVDDGNEAVLLEPQYVLLGDYAFEYEGKKYVVKLCKKSTINK